MYSNNVKTRDDLYAVVKNGALKDTIGGIPMSGRLLLKNGHVVDPKNGVDEVLDVIIAGDTVQGLGHDTKEEKGDIVIDCEGLLVVPGLIDIHLHLGDLYEMTTHPVFCAVEDGVTTALSPGAGNTFMSPALLGAEVDRGLPCNVGCYIGSAAALSTMLSLEELIAMFKGELPDEIANSKMSRNGITNGTAPLCIGLKDHMGHYLLPDEAIDKAFEVTSRANLMYMIHCQDPEHAERMVRLSKGRPAHLGHATAAGCGTHVPPVEGMQRVLDLIGGNVTGEFVTSMLRPGLGCREGVLMTKESQKLCYDALASKKVNILISDGQGDATMKGFGDTRDNVPCLVELAQMGVLSLSDAIATMTANPAALLASRCANPWWTEKMGHLGAGALANVTIIDQADKLATYTIVNGQVASFENRAMRKNFNCGGFVSKWGMVRDSGVGDLAFCRYGN